jgi:uncharacterized membrane protein YuzA (DUF378 family)
MQKNVGYIDRILRYIIGFFLLLLGVYGFNGIEGKLIGIVIALSSIIFFATSLTRKCPILYFFKITTTKKKSE